MISKNQIKFIRQLEQKKFRRREGVFVAEGTKVVGDLLQHYHPYSIFATEEWLADNQVGWLNNQVYKSLDSVASSNYGSAPMIQVVTSDELRRLSFQRHPQQVLAIFPLPTLLTHSLFHPLNFPSPSTAYKIQATSAPSSALPTGLVSLTSFAVKTPSMHGIRR